MSMDFGRAVAWTVMRDKLDCLIVAEAIKAGADVLDGQTVGDIETLPDRVVARTAS